MMVSHRLAMLLLHVTAIGCLLSLPRPPGWTKCLATKVHFTNDFGRFSRGPRIFGQQATVDKSELFIDRFSLSNWGVFQHIELNLNSTAAFAVITGETGAGKSVLIAGLEYMCGSSSFKGKKPLYRTNADGDCLINLSTLNNNYKRVYNPSTKKTVAESNGQRIALKSLTDRLSKRVMFWSMDNLDLLQNRNNELLLYIDKMLSGEGLEALDQVKYTYGEWKYMYDKITHLTELEKRMNNQNELELLHFYNAEVNNFGMKLKKLLTDIMYVTEDLMISLEPNEPVSVDTTKNSTSVYNKNIKNLLNLLTDYGADKKTKNDFCDKSVAKGMLILQEADFIFSGFYKAVKVPFSESSRTSTTASGGGNSKLRVAPSVSENVIDMTKVNLELYSEKILSLQLYIKSIGFEGTSILNQMDGIQDDLSGAVSAIKSAQFKLISVKNSLPDMEPFLSRINLLKSEWEGLLRKHNVNNPSDFDVLVTKWNTDIASMATISEELPLLRQQILDKRVAYVKASRQLSNHRRPAVSALSSQLNNILPTLEMSTKKVDIELVVSKEIEDYLNEEVKGINDGAKSIKPTGAICSDRGWDYVVMRISSSFISDSETVSPFGGVNSNGDGAVDAFLKPNSLSLSSGEMARLSLALETCVLINSDANSITDSVGTIIFDEIDAHVGGDAAIAIAKLLKSQGKKRQVIAVTHNPVFAAAADKHFVVKKTTATSSNGNNNSLIDSVVHELSGYDREVEIMRMTSGSINSAAGKEWAKTLLTLDFSCL